ncbi:MAG: hypothetical protein K2K57_00340, partial [Oscillospiraceae bacterium]|nr:hypothetical protein [Oscillospiraceae bacterium]
MNLFEQLKNMFSSKNAENDSGISSEIRKEAEPVPQTQTNAVRYSIEEIIKKVDLQIPPKPVVKLEPKRAERELSVFESKLGGVPYMP